GVHAAIAVGVPGADRLDRHVIDQIADAGLRPGGRLELEARDGLAGGDVVRAFVEDPVVRTGLVLALEDGRARRADPERHAVDAAAAAVIKGVAEPGGGDGRNLEREGVQARGLDLAVLLA